MNFTFHWSIHVKWLLIWLVVELIITNEEVGLILSIWVVGVCWALSVGIVTKIVDCNILVDYLTSSVLVERWLLGRLAIDNWSPSCISHDSVGLCPILKLYILHHIALICIFNCCWSLTIFYRTHWISLLVLHLIIHRINISRIVSLYSLVVLFLILRLRILVFLLIYTLLPRTHQHIRCPLSLENRLWILFVSWRFCCVLVIWRI